MIFLSRLDRVLNIQYASVVVFVALLAGGVALIAEYLVPWTSDTANVG